MRNPTVTLLLEEYDTLRESVGRLREQKKQLHGMIECIYGNYETFAKEYDRIVAIQQRLRTPGSG